jgi:hypothetical protein
MKPASHCPVMISEKSAPAMSPVAARNRLRSMRFAPSPGHVRPVRSQTRHALSTPAPSAAASATAYTRWIVHRCPRVHAQCGSAKETMSESIHAAGAANTAAQRSGLPPLARNPSLVSSAMLGTSPPYSRRGRK